MRSRVAWGMERPGTSLRTTETVAGLRSRYFASVLRLMGPSIGGRFRFIETQSACCNVPRMRLEGAFPGRFQGFIVTQSASLWVLRLYLFSFCLLISRQVESFPWPILRRGAYTWKRENFRLRPTLPECETNSPWFHK